MSWSNILCLSLIIMFSWLCSALICLKNAPNIPAKNFHALTRLDENRAKCQVTRSQCSDIDDTQLYYESKEKLFKYVAYCLFSWPSKLVSSMIKCQT